MTLQKLVIRMGMVYLTKNAIRIVDCISLRLLFVLKVPRSCRFNFSTPNVAPGDRLYGQSFITVEGESIEGEALDDVVVLGIVTFVINRTGRDDDCPV